MQPKQISDYVEFGTVLRYLQDAQEGTPFQGKELVAENIGEFFRQLGTLNLNITFRASSKLVEFYNKVLTKGKKHRLTNREASLLQNIMYDIRLTLDAESSGRLAFIVTDKRIDANKLYFSIETLLAPGVFELLPEIAKYDFEECGKCIAFERPTAAAFHLLRGTESVLRLFYVALVRRKRIPTLMWGPIIEALKRMKSPPPPELLNTLDNIRRLFRNPTQHPEKTYDIQEVQDLFGLCVDVVNRMARYLLQKGLLKDSTA
jgi:hypothetical protein